MLTRRPSYRKILNDLGGAEIAGMCFKATKLQSHSVNVVHKSQLTMWLKWKRYKECAFYLDQYNVSNWDIKSDLNYFERNPKEVFTNIYKLYKWIFI